MAAFYFSNLAIMIATCFANAPDNHGWPGRVEVPQ